MVPALRAKKDIIFCVHRHAHREVSLLPEAHERRIPTDSPWQAGQQRSFAAVRQGANASPPGCCCQRQAWPGETASRWQVLVVFPQSEVSKPLASCFHVQVWHDAPAWEQRALSVQVWVHPPSGDAHWDDAGHQDDNGPHEADGFRDNDRQDNAVGTPPGEREEDNANARSTTVQAPRRAPGKPPSTQQKRIPQHLPPYTHTPADHNNSQISGNHLHHSSHSTSLRTYSSPAHPHSQKRWYTWDTHTLRTN